MNSSESFSFAVEHDGQKTLVAVKTNMGRTRLRFNGVGLTSAKNFVVYSEFNHLKKDRAVSSVEPIYVSCKLMPTEIVNESEIKKEGIESIDEERSIQERYKAKSE